MFDFVLTVFKYIGLGFLLLIVFALVFGKRVKKKWEYEAEFRDEAGREFGEFDIELSQIQKQEPGYTLKAEFHMRHELLGHLQTVQVFLDDLLMLEGEVTVRVGCGWAAIDCRIRSAMRRPERCVGSSATDENSARPRWCATSLIRFCKCSCSRLLPGHHRDVHRAL